MVAGEVDVLLKPWYSQPIAEVVSPFGIPSGNDVAEGWKSDVMLRESVERVEGFGVPVVVPSHLC